MIPFYKIQLNEDTEGMDFIALVDVPAHLKGFEYFNEDKKPVKMQFNEEKRIVTGVAVATDVPIYRNSPDIGEHYVVFNKEETFKIAKKMMQNGFLHNVNEMHDSSKKLDGVYLIESYFLDSERGIKTPYAFENQNLKDGTWITSYYVENNEVWEDIKKGKFFGFSIEGWFDKTPINLTNKNQKKEKQMSEKKKLLDKILEVFKAEEKFGEAMTTDGVSVIWDGEELNEGVELRVVTDEGEVLAPDGEHAIQVGEAIIVVTTEAGIITSIAEQEEEMSSEATEDLGEVIIEFSKEINDKFAKQKEANSVELEKLNKQIDELSKKFDAFIDATDEEKRKFNKTTPVKKEVKGWKQILN